MHQQQNNGKLEGFMAELGRKLDQLLDKARQGAEEAKLADRLDDLKQTKDKLEHELHEFVKDDEKWKEVKMHLQGAAQELQRAFETTFTRKKNEDGQQQTGNPYENRSSAASGNQGNWSPNPEQRSADWKENSPGTTDWNNVRPDSAEPGTNPA